MTLGGDAVDDPGVPVVENRGEVGEEDHRDAGPGTKLAVAGNSALRTAYR